MFFMQAFYQPVYLLIFVCGVTKYIATADHLPLVPHPLPAATLVVTVEWLFVTRCVSLSMSHTGAKPNSCPSPDSAEYHKFYPL